MHRPHQIGYTESNLKHQEATDRNATAYSICRHILFVRCQHSYERFAQNNQKKLEDTAHRFMRPTSTIAGRWRSSMWIRTCNVFLAQVKPGLVKYVIQKIELQKGGKEALVTVGVDMPVEVIEATLPSYYFGRYSNGKWSMVISGAPPFQPRWLHRKSQPIPSRRIFAWIIRMLILGQNGRGIRLNQFLFTNVTDHPVHVSASLTGNCIQVGVTKESVGPGESTKVFFNRIAVRLRSTTIRESA